MSFLNYRPAGRIAIVGSNGQLGHDCQAVLGVPGTELLPVDVPEIDITSEDSICSVLTRFSPDIVVNCAAYTDVDACERDEEAALAVNALGPRHLARFVAERDAWLIHVSTDYVFDGLRPVPEPYRESDVPAPRTAYGRTKLAGEQAIVDETNRFTILRTAWLYGAHGNNFPKAILRRALEPDARLRVVADQHGGPTWSYRLAQQIAAILHSPPTGILHATAEEHGTWFDFARAFLGAMDISCPLEPCRTDDFPRPAPRPANSILQNGRLNEAGRNVMVPWQDDVVGFVNAHREALLAEAQSR